VAGQLFAVENVPPRVRRAGTVLAIVL